MTDPIRASEKSNQNPATTAFWSSWLPIFVGLVVVMLASKGFFSAQKWDYRVILIDDEKFESTMNSLGNDGWELVSARRASHDIVEPVPGATATPPMAPPTVTKTKFGYEVIFKRLK